MKEKSVWITVSITAVLSVVATVMIVLFAISGKEAKISFSLYSDGEVVRIFGDDTEILFRVGAEKDISEEENPVFAIFKGSSRVGTDLRVDYIHGRQVLLVHKYILQEVIAEGSAVIILEDCSPAKGMEWSEIVSKRGGAVSLNRDLRTVTKIREFVEASSNPTKE